MTDYLEIDDKIRTIFHAENERAGQIVRCLIAMKEAQKHWTVLPQALWSDNVVRAVIKSVYENVWTESLDNDVLACAEEITLLLNSRKKMEEVACGGVS